MHRIIYGVALLLCLTTSADLYAATTLYQISKGDYKIYLGGTIHLLRKSDFPLPQEFDSAYQHSQKLFLETDLQQASAPEFGQRMAQAMRLTGGQNLRTLLKPQVWAKLQHYVEQKKIPLDTLLPYNPAFVSILLSMQEMQAMGMGQGVDAYYYQQAQLEKKPVGQLETPAQALIALQKLSGEDANSTILNALEDLEDSKKILTKMITAWKIGDVASLDKDMAAKMRRETPQIYEALVVERNNRWLPTLKHLLTTPEVELVLVGSLHLTGQHGLLAQLRRAGYQVEPYHMDVAAPILPEAKK